MDKAALVDSDIRIGNEIIAHLGAAGVAVEDVLWVYSPQVEEWRLFIASVLVDEKGPIGAYGTILHTLKDAGILERVPYRRISVLSPADPIFTRLRAAFGLPRRQAFEGARRILGGAGAYEEAYVYEGSIHIVRIRKSGGQASYRIMFAPYKGPGGAMPTMEFADEQRLQLFLTQQIQVPEPVFGSVLNELELRGTATIPSIRAKEKDLKRWGLLPSRQR